MCVCVCVLTVCLTLYVCVLACAFCDVTMHTDFDSHSVDVRGHRGCSGCSIGYSAGSHLADVDFGVGNPQSPAANLDSLGVQSLSHLNPSMTEEHSTVCVHMH